MIILSNLSMRVMLEPNGSRNPGALSGLHAAKHPERARLDGISTQDHSVESELRLAILNVPLLIGLDHPLSDQDHWLGYP